jgi:hypothetical protein
MFGADTVVGSDTDRAQGVDIENRGDRPTAASADSLADESRLRRPARSRCVLTPADVVRDELTILPKKFEDVREVHPARSTRLVHTAAFSRE